MHSMGKTVGELHALLIEYEKGLPKKAATPQVMAIQGVGIQKDNKKSQNAKSKGKGKGQGKDKIDYEEETSWHCQFFKYLHYRIIFFPKNSWVYDTGCGTHICNTKQGLGGARKLKQRTLYLYVGNGVRAQVEAIGSYDLVLPNGLVICLDNCHYEPTITRGVVSVSRLVDNGFTQCFTNYGILVSKNDVLYFNVISSNGIYEIDMINRVPNVNSIYTVSNKRAKHNLDSTYLWHCHLAHISKKRIEKLQHDGLLKSTDEESFDKCVSCLSGKMTRKPFPHRTKRATDLLGIIHTDVCGPLRHVSRQDMVQSMINLTTLPLSFWDYALETAARILNMVQTKKVDKTPYELWYGKVPNLSYLKVWGREALVKRDTPNKLQQRAVNCIFIGYPKETMGYYFYFPPENKNVVASDIPMEVEGFEPPQEEVVPMRRSGRTHRAPDHLCLNVEVDENSLGDLNEPTNYKAAILRSGI
ncbi:retrotransposon protein, putative, ty1-copia subclass [Tanacetum coccineum]